MDKKEIFEYFLQNSKIDPVDVNAAILDTTQKEFLELEDIIQKIDYYTKKLNDYILSKKEQAYILNKLDLLKRKGSYIVYENLTKYQAEKNGKLLVKLYRYDKKYKTVPITWLYGKKGVYIIYVEEDATGALTPEYVGYSSSNLRKVILRHFQSQEDENEQHRYNVQRYRDAYYCAIYLLKNAKNAQLFEQILIYENYSKIEKHNKESYLMILLDGIVFDEDFIKFFDEKTRANKVLRRFFGLNKQAYEELKNKSDEIAVNFIFENMTEDDKAKAANEFKEAVKSCIDANIAQFMANINVNIKELEKIKEPEKDEFLSGEIEDVPF